jgi:hypothetical protein
MHSTNLSTLCPILALLTIAPAPAIAGEHCPSTGHSVVVTAAPPDDHALIGAGARQALQRLEHCAIGPKHTITINVVSEVRHPLAGLIFGYYDLEKRYIALSRLETIPELMKDTPYEGIPYREFYQSLAVHEVVHSVMHQNLKQPAWSQTAYEYPAYALQIASLPPDARALFLKSFDGERIKKAEPFSDSILAFAPHFFAARAHDHLVTSPDGCARLRAVMAGEGEHARIAEGVRAELEPLTRTGSSK